MKIIDLLYAPLFLVFIFFILYVLRNFFTSKETKRYFFPAVILKLIGALSLGLIYEFYYGGGDTLNYFSQSHVIYEAFWDSPSKWWSIITSHGNHDPDLFEYLGRIWWRDSPREFTVIKVAGFFSIFSGGSYLVISFWFAIFSFFGLWSMYNALVDLYPKYRQEFAIGIFYIPSVFFWGSGLMKDTLCMAGMGWLFYGFYYLFIKRKKIFQALLVILFASYLTLSVKPYIFYAFVPAAGLWIFNQYASNWSKFLRYLVLIIFGVIGIGVMYTAVNLEQIAMETKIQSDWITYASNRDQGSTYSIGENDGTVTGLFKLFLPAVNVSLFRPYLFEVRNPVMLLSSLEATFFMFFTLYSIYKIGLKKMWRSIINIPLVNFGIVFSIIFAFFIGVSSYNFGALVRYKIPLMPFYIISIYVILVNSKKQHS